MDLKLDGSSALITGASRGVGFAIAQALHSEGVQVMLNARGEAALELAAASLEGARGFAADVTDPDQARSLVEAAIAAFGRLDIVVCNTGSGASVPPGEETSGEWRRVIDLNFFSAVNVIDAARPQLLAQGSGVVVGISSICGSAALGAPVTYSSAKAALDMAIRGLARPFGNSGVRVVGVAPGNILTADGVWGRKLLETPDLVRRMLEAEVALRRFGRAEEIADLVCFLASDRAGFITGEVVVADGGQLRA